MKVYIISCNWGQGGPGSIARDLYNTLIDQGCEVRFAYGRDNIPSTVNSFYFADKLDIYTHYLQSSLFDKEGFCSKRSTKRLIKDISCYKPDVINIHNELGHVLNVDILVKFIKKSGIKTFWTLHDAWILTGHCITGLCERFNNGCGNCPRKKEYPKSLIDNSKKNIRKKENLLLPHIKNLSFITPSQWLANLIKKSYLNEYEVNVVNNGIDLEVFKPQVSNIRKKYNLERKIVLLAVANIWSKFKGLKFFYQLTKLLDVNRFSFVVIGDGQDENVKKDVNIISIPRTANVSELVDWYSTADIFVNTTMGDNFPTVNVESIACGTPVVTFNTGGSGEMVGTCGLVVEQGSIEELYNGIIQILNNSITEQQCVEHAKSFDKRKKFSKYIDIFKDSLL